MKVFFFRQRSSGFKSPEKIGSSLEVVIAPFSMLRQWSNGKEIKFMGVIFL
jgi:hypothetical protein